MKRNIDLTINRDFRKRSREGNGLNNIFESLILATLPERDRNKKRYPWTRLIDKVFIKRSQVFFTGSLEDISDQKDSIKYEIESCTHCQKCGEPVEAYPWNEFGWNSFCKKCEASYNKRFGSKYPWPKEISINSVSLK